MSNSVNIEGYFNTIKIPWGQLFYKLIWNHLDYKGKTILDFGSGFGITADYLAKHNDVTAVEPNQDMLAYRTYESNYKQITGSLEELKKMPDNSFDVVICHNVLEYIDEREELFAEFYRLLKNNGALSIVKHNKTGKIMQKAVFENDVDTALKLLHNEDIISANFGMIHEYGDKELEDYMAGKFVIQNKYGVRIFFGLQKNEFKKEDDWISKMYVLESNVEEAEDFRNIAFFHHFILCKKS